MSKGSARRPRAIDSNTEAEHWDNTFRPLHTTAQQAEGMITKDDIGKWTIKRIMPCDSGTVQWSSPYDPSEFGVTQEEG